MFNVKNGAFFSKLPSQSSHDSNNSYSGSNKIPTTIGLYIDFDIKTIECERDGVKLGPL